MQRRGFLKTAGVAAATAAVATTAQASDSKTYEWKMVTSWPKNFPGIGTGAEYLAKKITSMTNGQVKVSVYAGGELVPPLEVFDAVSDGAAQMGHSAAYYWKGKSPSTQFFGAVPFGMTVDETNAWLYYGGGMDLWKEVYAPFGLVPGAAGNSGMQMAGWFNKEINSIEDLKGLKMRLPGLGGEVLKRLGGVPVVMPGGEIFTSLRSGTIDATDWVGPYNDLAFGLFKAAKYYYYPGWAEPSAIVETFFNKKALEELPPQLQEIVQDSVRIAAQDMLAEYDARNSAALDTLVNKHGVQLKALPDDVLSALKKTSAEVVSEVAKQSELTQKVYDSYTAFDKKMAKYALVTQRAYQNARVL